MTCLQQIVLLLPSSSNIQILEIIKKDFDISFTFLIENNWNNNIGKWGRCVVVIHPGKVLFFQVPGFSSEKFKLNLKEVSQCKMV